MSGSPGPTGRGARVQLLLYRLAAALVVLYHRAALPLVGDSKRSRYAERLGLWDGPRPDGGSVIWIHAASVGEVAVASVLVAGLRGLRPQSRILLTCNTATGRSAAASAGADELRYFPIDHPAVVASVLDRVAPALFIFIETEIWPALLAELERRALPAVMVNARVSERSYPRYLRVRALVGRVLGGVRLFCVRDRESLERLTALGAEPGRTCLTGDLKFDSVPPAAGADLLGPLTEDEPAVVAASTREGEEEVLLEALEQVHGAGRRLRLVLAPRHPERSATVTRLASERGLAVLRWSEVPEAGGQDRPAWDVLVLDSVGQLRSFMRGAVGVFVGGTLVPVGGHNLLEPASFGVAVASGPHLANVNSQARALADNDALVRVDDAAGLARLWSDWLDRPGAAREAGRRALDVVEAGRGALARTLKALEPYLGER